MLAVSRSAALKLVANIDRRRSPISSVCSYLCSVRRLSASRVRTGLVMGGLGIFGAGVGMLWSTKNTMDKTIQLPENSELKRATKA